MKEQVKDVIKIAVCDDEALFVEQISEKIEKYLPDCEIKRFFSGAALLAEKGKFDVCFLDIQMNNMNGIEVAGKLREQEEEMAIVFITGAREYVFEAFDVAALHYLMKPVDDRKLQNVLTRVKKEIEKREKRKDKKILIKTKNKNITLNLSDVLYFENERRKIVVHRTEEKFSFYGVMSDMEKQTGGLFYRCHRGYLVNLAYVAEYSADSILLTNGERLYMSKERYSDFVKQYMRYLRGSVK